MAEATLPCIDVWSRGGFLSPTDVDHLAQTCRVWRDALTAPNVRQTLHIAYLKTHLGPLLDALQEAEPSLNASLNMVFIFQKSYIHLQSLIEAVAALEEAADGKRERLPPLTTASFTDGAVEHRVRCTNTLIILSGLFALCGEEEDVRLLWVVRTFFGFVGAVMSTQHASSILSHEVARLLREQLDVAKRNVATFEREKKKQTTEARRLRWMLFRVRRKLNRLASASA